MANLVEDEGGTIAVRVARGVDDDLDWQRPGIDERVKFASLDVFLGVGANLAVEAVPFPADFRTGRR